MIELSSMWLVQCLVYAKLIPSDEKLTGLHQYAL